MKSHGLMGILVAGVVVIATVYVYNKFVAKPGTSIADLGKPVAK